MACAICLLPLLMSSTRTTGLPVVLVGVDQGDLALDGRAP